jgi:hypothetical protein
MNSDNTNRKAVRRPAMTMVVGLSIPLVFFGGMALANQLGWWKTSGGGALAVSRQATSTGTYNPADIRGSTTFGTIETSFRIPAALIAQAFGIKAADPRVVTAKFVDSVYGEMHALDGETIDIGTDAVKLFVARMTGLPYTEEENTGLPESAIDVILTLGAGMTDEQRQSLLRKAGESRTMRFDEDPTATPAAVQVVTSTAAPAAAPDAAAAPGAATVVSNSAGFMFQGKTSFADVIAAGLSQAQIESVLGMPMGSKIQSIKDFCESKGLKYSTVRAGLSQLMGL